ncbi:PAS domain-containing sensor histidine kinase [Limibacter armeniacum]|uniref:PAS domain-containing sensor histidine kinase n=1 Tax=Limibacter armeniacum TaxID=466084 RepID=UPI002FE69868
MLENLIKEPKPTIRSLVVFAFTCFCCCTLFVTLLARKFHQEFQTQMYAASLIGDQLYLSQSIVNSILQQHHLEKGHGLRIEGPSVQMDDFVLLADKQQELHNISNDYEALDFNLAKIELKYNRFALELKDCFERWETGISEAKLTQLLKVRNQYEDELGLFQSRLSTGMRENLEVNKVRYLVFGGFMFAFIVFFILFIGSFDLQLLNISSRELKHIFLAASTSNRGVVIMDENGKVTWCNQTFIRQTGYTLQELKQVSVDKSLNSLGILKQMWKLIVQQEITTIEFRDEHKNGDDLWIRLYMNPFLVKNGRTSRYVGLTTDVTIEKQAQEQLAESELLKDVILKVIPDHVFLNDKDGRFVAFATSNEDELFTKPDFFMGKKIEEVLPHPLAEIIYQKVLQTLKSKGEEIFEYELPNKGEVQYFEARMKAVDDERVVTIIREISDRRKAEELNEFKTRLLEKEVKKGKKQLQHVEERFSRLFEASSDGLLFLKEGVVTDCNSAAQVLFELSSLDQIYGKSLSCFSSEITLNGLHASELLGRAESMCLSYGKTNFEWKFKTLNGISFDADVSLNRMLIGEDGYVLVTIRDISIRKKADLALRKSQEMYQLLSENTSDLIGLHHAGDGTFSYVSAACAQMLGYAQHEMQNKSLFEFVSMDELTIVKEYFRMFTMNETVEENIQYKMKRKNGQFIWVETVLNNITEKDDEVGKILSATRDITVRKHAEMEIIQTLKKEKELNDLRSRFVTMASHEFRTPITTMKTSIQLIEIYTRKMPAQDREKLHKHCSRALYGADRLVELLDDILLLGKAEAPLSSFSPVAMDVVEFVSQQIDNFFPMQEGEEIKISVQGVKKEADTDPDILKHILTNLVGNALKYSEEGSSNPEVKIKFGEGDNWVLEVKDYGIGIPIEEQNKLFSAFYRASNVGDIQGTGLGLMIVKELVKMHRGSLTFKSSVGEGTTFWVQLPLKSPKRDLDH